MKTWTGKELLKLGCPQGRIVGELLRTINAAPHTKDEEVVYAQETEGLDARFYCGKPDISELPSAYKNAAAVQEDMHRFALCDVVDRVQPYGCIMAGDWQNDAPWRKRRR